MLLSKKVVSYEQEGVRWSASHTHGLDLVCVAGNPLESSEITPLATAAAWPDLLLKMDVCQ